MKIYDFAKYKREQRPISMVTAYDAGGARLAAASEVDCLLVGDSVAMVVHGHTSTLAATVEMMRLHTEAVRRGAPAAFIVADMPFLSVRKGLERAMDAVHALMQAGANAVKIEGVEGHAELIAHIVASGVPVMGHLGLTPQSFESLGAFKVQGRGEAGERVLAEARALEKAGAFALVLECVPAALAGRVTAEVGIPTIGIGAGVKCDGQVLVYHDLLGLNLAFAPKFLRRYARLEEPAVAALTTYARDVRERRFPSIEESYGD